MEGARKISMVVSCGGMDGSIGGNRPSYCISMGHACFFFFVFCLEFSLFQMANNSSLGDFYTSSPISIYRYILLPCDCG